MDGFNGVSDIGLEKEVKIIKDKSIDAKEL